MYVPSHFSFADSADLLTLIRQYNFGLLTTPQHEAIDATHLPVLVSEFQEKPCLLGHFAKANAHWRSAENRQSLFVFQGPHCYISPNWYVNPNVPTWNYVAVHVYGTVELLNDAEATHQIVLDLSDQHEMNLADPWVPDYDESMLNAIISFRFHIDKIDAKQKLSQNKSPQDRVSAIAELKRQGSENEVAVAELMEASLSVSS